MTLGMKPVTYDEQINCLDIPLYNRVSVDSTHSQNQLQDIDFYKLDLNQFYSSIRTVESRGQY